MTNTKAQTNTVKMAQPEPEAVGPTDEELDACADEFLDWNPEGVRAYARAVLARYGRPAPVPAEGEVADLVAWLRRHASAQEAAGTHWAGQLARAADLLERQVAPVPVAVSERLPGAEDCDVNGMFWWGRGSRSKWVLLNMPNAKVLGYTHWLPAHALPLPQRGGGAMSKPPLWEVMQNAGSNAPGTPRDAIAAEIRALRDWLVPEEGEVIPDGRTYVELASRFHERRRLRALLTAEADRAERGEVEP